MAANSSPRKAIGRHGHRRRIASELCVSIGAAVSTGQQHGEFRANTIAGRIFPLAAIIDSDHKPRPSLGLVFGFLIPAGAVRNAYPVFRLTENGCRSSTRMSVEETRRCRFESDRWHNEDSSVRLEQMSCKHRVAGSTPAPTLRFSLIS